ncbi:MAG: hypothetical protein M0Z69_12320 [Actinomycetota bacterium]|nr:hypothetical protein [Actinomycetota bacterium]
MAEQKPAQGGSKKVLGMNRRTAIIAGVGSLAVVVYVWRKNSSSSSSTSGTSLPCVCADGSTPDSSGTCSDGSQCQPVAIAPSPSVGGNTIYNVATTVKGRQRPNLYDYKMLTVAEAEAADKAGGKVLYLTRSGYLSPWRGRGTAPGATLWVSTAWWRKHHPGASTTHVKTPTGQQAHPVAVGAKAASGAGTVKRRTHKGVQRAGAPKPVATTDTRTHAARPATALKVHRRPQGRQRPLKHKGAAA